MCWLCLQMWYKLVDGKMSSFVWKVAAYVCVFTSSVISAERVFQKIANMIIDEPVWQQLWLV